MATLPTSGKDNHHASTSQLEIIADGMPSRTSSLASSNMTPIIARSISTSKEAHVRKPSRKHQVARKRTKKVKLDRIINEKGFWDTILQQLRKESKWSELVQWWEQASSSGTTETEDNQKMHETYALLLWLGARIKNTMPKRRIRPNNNWWDEECRKLKDHWQIEIQLAKLNPGDTANKLLTASRAWNKQKHAVGSGSGKRPVK